MNKMNEEMTIELKELRFFAYHGLYAEERKTGNEFEINIAVSYTPVAGTIASLDDTVNYMKLYELLKAEMKKPRDLLETFVMEVTEVIHRTFFQIKKVEIFITKLNPPIAGFTGSAGVRYCKEY